MQNSVLCCFNYYQHQMFSKSKPSRIINWLKIKRNFWGLFFKAIYLYFISTSLLPVVMGKKGAWSIWSFMQNTKLCMIAEMILLKVMT